MKYRLTAIVLVLSILDSNLCFAQTKNLMPAYQAISTPDFGYLPTYVARANDVDSPAARGFNAGIVTAVS
jgi:hypothetical protein